MPRSLSAQAIRTSNVIALIKTGARKQCRAIAPEWAEPRGVYMARHTLGGRIVLYAVDSTGDVVKWKKLRHNEPQKETLDWLQAVLDTVDPVPEQPRLELVS